MSPASLWDGVRRFFSGPPELAPDDASLARRGAEWARLALRVNLMVALLATVAYAFARGGELKFLATLGLALLLAAASFLVGAVLGFIFGIPRRLQQAPAPPTKPSEEEGAKDDGTVQIGIAYESNTSLEQISDWLTKILVGLTLTQWTEVRRGFQDLIAYMVPAYGAGSEVFVGAIVVVGAICGFFTGYLPTRLFLWLALTQSDLEGRRMNERKEENVRAAEGVRAAAPAAVQAAPGDDGEGGDGGGTPEAVRKELASLGQKYESLRSTLRPGPERTRRMEEVLSRMRGLAPKMGADLLSEQERSGAPGDKLALIAWLQVYPRAGKLQWLAECLGSEKPFIGYHAAVALLCAARDPSIDANLVLDAIRRAGSLLEPTDRGTDRARVLTDAEQQARTRLAV